MNNFLKTSINTCAGYLNKIFPIQIPLEYKLIERNNKIIYFSAFTFELEEFSKIYFHIKTIKENLFRKLLDATKYAVNNILSFPPNITTEKDKVLVLFSWLFLYYYSKFSYTKCQSFELFYSKDINTLLEKYTVKINNPKQFSIYLYSFYYQIINEISKCNYEEDIMILYQNNQNSINNNTNGIQLNANISTQINNIKGAVTNNLFMPLMTAKERIIDMVYLRGKEETALTNEKYKEWNNSEININYISENQWHDLYNSQDSTKLPDDIIWGSNSTPGAELQSSLNSTANTLSNSDVYMKRLWCEWVKSDCDENTKTWVDKISSEIDLSKANEIYNNLNKENIQFIYPFLCYIIELNSMEIQEKFKTTITDHIVRFIFIAKHIYWHAFEIYFSINDLAYTDTNTFVSLWELKLGFDFSFCHEQDKEKNETYKKCLFDFFKKITEEFNKSNTGMTVKDKWEHIWDQVNKDWKEWIVKKCQEMKSFCAV